jgi:DUF1680 family protein
MEYLRNSFACKLCHFDWIKRLAFLLAATALTSAHMAGAAAQQQRVQPGGSRLKAEPFSLSSVRLLDGPFKRAQERDLAYLLSLEPDRLLHNFRTEAGLPPKGAVYGGWESLGVAGHTLGHYLSACAMMYQATGDARMKQRVDYIVDELALCQQANGDGYLSAIPGGKAIFAAIKAGDGGAINRGWVPWYTTHKLLAGLRDAYERCDNQKALRVMIALADWTLDTTRNLSDAEFQKMLDTEQGGMNEALADLYALTGNQKYLNLARRFCHRRILDPMAEGRDMLNGFHANTQIPKVIGFARLYELTGDDRYRQAARFFWQTMVQNRTYAIGGNSDREHFFPPEQFDRHLGPETAETCNTYNMLKLTSHLFAWEPSSTRMDYYERALYNHILASQDPDTGMMTYFVSLKPGHVKIYNTPENSFWCCTGTGMENHARYGEAIYFHDNDALYVNLFIPSTLAWHDKGLTIRQQTRFPEEETTRLTVECAHPVSLVFKIRRPAWAKGMTFRVNGRPLNLPATATHGGYETIARTWHNGDRIEVHLPMALVLDTLPHDPNKVAVMYGPLVLAGALGRENLPNLYLPNQTDLDGLPSPEVPALVSATHANLPGGAQAGLPDSTRADLLRHIAPVPGSPLTFQTEGLGRPNDVTLVPFYNLHHQRYTVYWDAYTPQEWQAQEARRLAATAERRALEARTVDEVRPGEQQPEVDHHEQGEATQSGDFNGGKWRHALNGGWFSYDLKVLPDRPQTLRCTYWGDDTGGREFDILVDGTKVATQTLERNRPGEFFTVDYPLPLALTQGKQRVTVRFQAHPGKMAGGLYGCLMLKQE